MEPNQPVTPNSQSIDLEKLLADAFNRLCALHGKDRADAMNEIKKKNVKFAGELGRRLKEKRLSALEPWENVKSLFSLLGAYPTGEFVFKGYNAFYDGKVAALFNPDCKYFEGGKWNTHAVAFIVDKSTGKTVETMTHKEISKVFN